jgi:flavin-binding monooxygenase-like protein
MNTVLPQLAGHGRIGIKPDITEFAGNKVRFSDGSEVEADLVVFATGYEISIPFIDNDFLFGSDGQPLFYLNVFHPELDDLFAVGLIQANGSIWRLADDQSQLVASYLIALAERHERADWFKALKRQGHESMVQGSYVKSDRHKLEANYYAYRRALKRHRRRFGAMAKAMLKSGRLMQAPDRFADDDANTVSARAP